MIKKNTIPFIFAIGAFTAVVLFYFLQNQKNSITVEKKSEIGRPHHTVGKPEKAPTHQELARKSLSTAPLPRKSRQTPAFIQLKKDMRFDPSKATEFVMPNGEKTIAFPPRISVTAARIKPDGSIDIGCFHDPEKLEEHIENDFSQTTKYSDF